MKINLNSKKDTVYTPAPAGIHQAVLVDIQDVGVKEVIYDGKVKLQPTCRFVFQIEELNTEREPAERFTVSASFHASLNEKSRMYQFLKAWSALPTKEEVAAKTAANEPWETDSLIGRNATLSVEHVDGIGKNEGKIYANIASILPISPKTPKLRPLNFVRLQDRPAKAA